MLVSTIKLYLVTSRLWHEIRTLGIICLKCRINNYSEPAFFTNITVLIHPTNNESELEWYACFKKMLLWYFASLTSPMEDTISYGVLDAGRFPFD